MRPERRTGAKAEAWRPEAYVSGRLFCYWFRIWPRSDKPSRQGGGDNSTGMFSGKSAGGSVPGPSIGSVPRRRGIWQSGVPFFYPSIAPKVGFERCGAAPSGYEHGSSVAPRARPATGSWIAHLAVDMAVLLSYVAVGSICQYSQRIQRLATAAAATLPGLPAAFSRSFRAFHLGTNRARRCAASRSIVRRRKLPA